MWRELLPHLTGALSLLGGASGLTVLVRLVMRVLTWRAALYGNDETSKRAFRLLKLPPLEPDSGDSAERQAEPSGPVSLTATPRHRRQDGSDTDHDGGGEAVA
jgi:hypothetical protein